MIYRLIISVISMLAVMRVGYLNWAAGNAGTKQWPAIVISGGIAMVTYSLTTMFIKAF